MILTVLIVFGIYAGLLLVIGHPLMARADTSESAAIVTQSEQTQPAKTEQSAVVQSKKPVFKGPVIVGITATVDLNKAEQEVNQVWQQLMNNQVLINNVDWSKGNIKAYAYYTDFDENMSKARLSLGFAGDDLKLHSSLPHVTLPTGQFEQFGMNASTGSASNEAWSKAYIHKNLIERYTLNRNGEQVSSDALVILK